MQTRSGIGFTQFANPGNAASLIPLGPSNSVYWSNGVLNAFSTNPIVNSISVGPGAGPFPAGGAIRMAHGTEIAGLSTLGVATTLLTFGGGATPINTIILGNASTIANVRLETTVGHLYFQTIRVFSWTGTTVEWRIPLAGYEAGVALPTLRQGNQATGGGNAFTLRARGSTGAASSGSPLRLQGGRRGAGAFRGAVQFQLNPDDSTFETMIEAANVVADNLVVSLALGVPVTAVQMPANTGNRVIFIADAAAIPSVDAVTGFIQYSDGARPAWRFLGTNLRLNGTSATASIGTAAALPALPEGYLDIQLNGVQRKVAYWAA